ncbi:MAG TPA: right-handed parallel beta-helix repeat-containing protein [Thermoleophilaceae bacterium]|nr:right-handed parallel beta-helix repeat-containing protein [Thermoleophilaceae bacterium]
MGHGGRATEAAGHDGATRRDLMMGAALAAGGIGAGALLSAEVAEAASSGDYISVKDAAYGATGNGTTDDGPAIRSAITAAPTGGAIVFPPGTYRIDLGSASGLIFSKSLTFIGLGDAVLKATPDTGFAVDRDMIRVTGSADFTMRGLTVAGPSAYATGTANGYCNGLKATTTGKLLVDTCVFKRWTTGAIHFQGVGSRVRVRNTEIDGGLGGAKFSTGILAAVNGASLDVEGCWIHDVGSATEDPNHYHGIYSYTGTDVSIRGTAFGKVYEGRQVQLYYGSTPPTPARHVLIEGCYFDATDGATIHGIVTSDLTMTKIYDCTFRGHQRACVLIHGAIDMIGCDVQGRTDGLFYLLRADETASDPGHTYVPRGTVTNCRFTGEPDKDVILSEPDGDLRFIGCEFTSAADEAIEVGHATVRLTVADCSFTGAGAAAIQVDDGAAAIAVRDCRFGNPGHAVQSQGTAIARVLLAGNDFSQEDESFDYVNFPTEFLEEGNWGAGGGARWQDVASAATVTLPPLGGLLRVTGATSITSIAASWNGRRVTLRFASTPTLTKGSNLKLASSLVATADDTIELVCDGTNWYEMSRSANS